MKSGRVGFLNSAEFGTSHYSQPLLYLQVMQIANVHEEERECCLVHGLGLLEAVEPLKCLKNRIIT